MDESTQNAFADLAKEMETGTGGPVTFLAKGTTKIRLVLEPGRKPTEFAERTWSTYNEKQTERFMVLALVIEHGGEKMTGEEAQKVVPVLIPKKVYTSIISNAAYGYELFDYEEGHGITILRTGEGLSTGYEVIMSPKPVKIDKDQLIKPEKKLAEYAKDYAEWSANRGRGSGNPAPQKEASLGGEAGW